MPFSDEQLRSMHGRIQGSFFAYDLDAMGTHLRGLATDGVRLWYACKANPLSAVLETVKEAGFSFDVASLGELEQVLRSGVRGKNILLTGPAKSRTFLSKALDAGVEWFVLESPRQMEILQEMADARGQDVNALLRLQLSWEGREASVLGGSAVSVFGMDPAGWSSLPEASRVKLRGVHVFQWGNQLSVQSLRSIWKRIAAEAKLFAAAHGFPLDVLDLGGGLGISYEDPALRFPWSEARALLAEARELSGAGELWLELGRYAVGPFGQYVTQVMERKEVRGEEFLVCAGGAQHLVRPALVGESFPVRAIGGEGALQEFHVHGPLCTALDRLGTYTLPGGLSEGDLLAFSQAGAYGFTESMPFFLCHELPGEIILKEGEVSVIREVAPPSTWLR